MRKAEAIILSVLAILWISAGVIATQKVIYKVKDGECAKQPVLVPVVLNSNCKPLTVMLRKCENASDSTDTNCSIKERYNGR